MTNGLGDAIKKLKEFEIAEKAAAMGAKVLRAALVAALAFGVTWAIDKLVQFVDSLVTTTKEAIEQQDNLREQALENERAIQEENDAIDGLLSKYIELVSQNTDLSAVKKDLTDIQNQLINTYGVEADSIDLLNGKITENIAILRERKRGLAEEYVYNADNVKAYNDAVYLLEAGKGSTSMSGIAETTKYFKLDLEYGVDAEVIKAWNEAGLNYAADQGNTDLYAYGDLEEKKNTWLKMAEILKTFDEYNDVTFAQLMEFSNGAEQLQNELTSVKTTMEKYRSSLKIDESEAGDEFYSLIEKATELNQIIQGDGTATKRFAASQELKSLKKEIYELAEDSTELKNVADITFSAFETGASNATTSTVDLEKAFYESLEEKQKGSLKNIELIENAMQTLVDGKYISWDDFWDIRELDTDRAILSVEQIDDEVKVNIQQLQQVKDKYVKDEIESLKKENQAIQDQIEGKNGVVNGLKDQLEYELLILDAQIAQGANSEGAAKLLEEQRQKVQEIRDEIKGYEDQMERNDLLILMWNTHYGDTIDNAENYAKAMTSGIDSFIDIHESEKDILEKEKDVLNEQLNTLEEQKKTIEDIIDDYKSVVDIVGKATDDEIDLLKKQQEAEENAIQEKIDALKESREQQEEENTLTEKQIALQEKLRDLEKARQTKIRTYSSERGWHFDVDKEAVANAQTAVDEAQSDYDKAVDDKAYNDQLSALEKEKELIAGNFEDQIKAYEDYYDEWKAIIDEQTEAENEQLAQQILGSEWREKIKNKDTDVLDKFKSDFQGYNNQLDNLVNNEIANMNLSIKAKENEINAKKEQIQAWKDYKIQVENAIDSIKGKYEDYVDVLDQVVLDENASYEERERALAEFLDKYQGYANEFQDVQSQLVAYAMEAVSPLTGTNESGSIWYDIREKAANALSNIRFPSHAKGGVVDYTGLAMLHGEKQRPEVVFNAAQSKQLYDMVMKGEFADLAAARAAEGFTSVLKSIESARTFNKNINNTNNSNTASVVIQHMDINGVQNPADFANEFNKNMKQYLQNVYVEGLVK